MKRTPLLRRTPLKRTPFTAKSQPMPWLRHKAELLGRSNGSCERCGVTVLGRVSHIHHLRMRSQGGSDDLSNLVLVCPPCHDHIHANPAESYEAGWLIRTEAS